MSDIEKEMAVETQSFRKLEMGKLIHPKTDAPKVEKLPDRPTESLLAERQTTHGDFETNAKVSQHLKKLFLFYLPESAHDVHHEALDMIALKISRILSGQADHAEHWDDLAGYAKLASKVCTK